MIIALRICYGVLWFALFFFIAGRAGGLILLDKMGDDEALHEEGVDGRTRIQHRHVGEDVVDRIPAIIMKIALALTLMTPIVFGIGV